MKEKNLYLLVIGMLILFCPALTMASQMPEHSVIKVEHITTISQDYSLQDDSGISDLNSGNSEVQIRILRHEISVPIKTTTSFRLIKINFFNKNTRNQTIAFVSQEIISKHHCSILFTGVFLI